MAERCIVTLPTVDSVGILDELTGILRNSSARTDAVDLDEIARRRRFGKHYDDFGSVVVCEIATIACTEVPVMSCQVSPDPAHRYKRRHLQSPRRVRV